MTQSDYIVYSFWAVLPGVQTIYLTYLYLEFLGGKAPKSTVSDAFRNLIFLSLCLLISLAIDSYFLETVSEMTNELLVIVGLNLPHTFFRLVTYPIILVLGGKFFKGTKSLEPKKNQLLKYNRDTLEEK